VPVIVGEPANGVMVGELENGVIVMVAEIIGVIVGVSVNDFVEITAVGSKVEFPTKSRDLGSFGLFLVGELSQPGKA
jgi:hypothetical protein